MSPARALAQLVRHSSTLRPAIAVDALCIPLRPLFALADLLPPPTPLPRATLLKLHRLAALLPPTTESAFTALDSLGALVAVIEGVRHFPSPAGQEERGIVDARVRAPDQVDRERNAEQEEENVLERIGEAASVREGPYFVVRTPEGIRGKAARGARE